MGISPKSIEDTILLLLSDTTHPLAFRSLIDGPRLEDFELTEAVLSPLVSAIRLRRTSCLGRRLFPLRLILPPLNVSVLILLLPLSVSIPFPHLSK